VPGVARELADAVVRRVNRSSALWQQFGVMADVILVPGVGEARYLEEVPFHYALDGGVGEAGAVLPSDEVMALVTLEYGPDHDKIDPFDISVRRVAQDRPEQAADAAYLHPVIRVYRGGELVAEHHMAENLENHWDGEDTHRAPLEAFFEKVIAS
jgi:hypothetical protein